MIWSKCLLHNDSHFQNLHFLVLGFETAVEFVPGLRILAVWWTARRKRLEYWQILCQPCYGVPFKTLVRAILCLKKKQDWRIGQHWQESLILALLGHVHCFLVINFVILIFSSSRNFQTKHIRWSIRPWSNCDKHDCIVPNPWQGKLKAAYLEKLNVTFFKVS